MIVGVLVGPTVVTCFNSDENLGVCLRGKMADAGLFPQPATAVVDPATPAEPQATGTDAPAVVDAEAEPETEVAVGEPAFDVNPPADDAAETEELVAATFGLLRAEPDGSVVIAGSGEPGTEVEVYADDTLLGRTTVESSGDWVLVPDEPVPAGGVEITLAEAGKDARAAESFVVVIDEDRSSEPLVVASTPGEASEILQGLEAPERMDVAAAEPAAATPVPEAAAPSADTAVTPSAPAEPSAAISSAPPAEPATDEQAAEPATTPAADPAPIGEPAETTTAEPADTAEPTASTEAASTTDQPAPDADPASAATDTAPQQTPTPGTAATDPQEPPAVPLEPAPATEDEPAATSEEPAAVPEEPAGEPAASPAAPAAAPAVPPTIDAIEVEEGRTFFAGSGPDGATVRLYVDDTFIADAIVEGGRWLVEAGNVLTRPSQRVRADLLEAGSADVAARAEVDFVIDLPEEGTPTAIAAADVPPPPTAEPEPVAPTADASEQPADAPAQPASAPTPADTAPQPEAEPAPAPASPAEPETAATGGLAASTQPAPPAEPAATDDAAAPAEPPAPAEPAAPAEPTATAEAEAPEAEVPTLVAISVGGPDAERFAAGKAIIRRGDNLWTIARRVYGEGIKYTTIYEANTGQIRDPDRIYPGQVFDLPTGEN